MRKHPINIRPIKSVTCGVPFCVLVISAWCRRITVVVTMGLLPDTQNCVWACAANAGNVFPPPLVSDPDMHHGTCVTHAPWCMSGSLTSGFLWSPGGGENVPGIPSACATRNFWYLVRGRLRLPTLSYRRYRGDMIEVFKITHGLYYGDVTAGFLQEQKDSITRGHKYSLFKRQSNLNMRKFSFANRVVDQWNNLPDSVVHAKTVQSFESRLDKLWKESEVMYDHDCDVKLLTSSRNLRYTNVNTCAQPENDDIICDLMSEA